jgi:MFS family permease
VQILTERSRRRQILRQKPSVVRLEAVDPALIIGLSMALVAAALLRIINLGDNLPQIVQFDEAALMSRALQVLDGVPFPAQFDWPQASVYVLAGALGLGSFFSSSSIDVAEAYVLGRAVFAVVSLAAVGLAGAVGAQLADRPEEKRAVALGTATVMAVSYISVRLGRWVHPEHLQIVFLLASFLSVLAYDRSRRWVWLAAAGVLAGMAGATKYVGVAIALPAAVAVISSRKGRSGIVRHLGFLGGATVVGFLAGSPGAVIDFVNFREGLLWQLSHQAQGHLGYEGDFGSWWFHLSQSLPGNWGWPFTVVSIAGTIWVLKSGSRAHRLALAFVLPVFAILGLSSVRFPHYILILTPFMASLGVVALLRFIRRTPRARSLLVGLALSLMLGMTVLDDVRLVRAAGGTDTRSEAILLARTLSGPVWAESYALPAGADRQLGDFGSHPEVLECDCYAVISSYQEERFRRDPNRFEKETAIYDAMRVQGSVVAVVRPMRPLAYNWDVLPQWGLRTIPVVGRMGATGPTLTVLDLRRRDPSNF